MRQFDRTCLAKLDALSSETTALLVDDQASSPEAPGSPVATPVAVSGVVRPGTKLPATDDPGTPQTRRALSAAEVALLDEIMTRRERVNGLAMELVRVDRYG